VTSAWMIRALNAKRASNDESQFWSEGETKKREFVACLKRRGCHQETPTCRAKNGFRFFIHISQQKHLSCTCFLSELVCLID
jgi:hypothetical protein